MGNKRSDCERIHDHYDCEHKGNAREYNRSSVYFAFRLTEFIRLPEQQEAAIQEERCRYILKERHEEIGGKGFGHFKSIYE